VFFGLLGAVLTATFKDTVLSSAQDSLRNQILLLMADIEVEGQTLAMPAIASGFELVCAN